jgi:hypothetical protein
MRLPESLPARFRALEPGAAAGWGRLTALSPRAARLETLGPLPGPVFMAVSFQLGAESFEDLSCRATRVEKDEDGYYAVDFEFLLLEDIRRLQEAVSRMMLTGASQPSPHGVDGTA